MARTQHTSRRGFSLIELVIVVVIIGIIAAIAIPRMSRGTAGAADSAVSGNLNVLRNAIELYATEHGGAFPAAATIVDQLTKYTNDAGAVSPDGTKTGTYIYGPYLRKIPPITVGAIKSDSTKNTLIGTAATDPPTTGWVYNATTGEIKPNLPAGAKDQNDKLYSDY